MKSVLFIFASLLIAGSALAARHEMDYYNATTFILNHLEIPAIGQTKELQGTKTFSNVSISTDISSRGWGSIFFQSAEGSFSVDRSINPGLFEELLNSPQVKSANASRVSVDCKYLLGQKAQNWFSPFVPHCNLSFF